MENHVKKLANDNSVTLHWVSSWHEAIAFVSCREAYLPRISSPGDYLIALHELGHILFPHALRYEKPGIYSHLAAEGLAWAWAMDNALPVPASDWEHALSASLVNHYMGAL